MKRVLIVVLLLTVAGVCKDRNQNAADSGRSYHSVIPLGAERIDLKPSKKQMFILATAESPQFEGWHGVANARTLFSSDGKKVKFYPSHVRFRLTATAMRPDMLVLESYGSINVPDAEIGDYLLHLGFRVLVFHGLEKTIIEPDKIRMIGMPAEVPYAERIYHISFNLQQRIPITDRIVLEVTSPTGNRLCKFHLDLF